MKIKPEFNQQCNANEMNFKGFSVSDDIINFPALPK